MGAVAAEAFSPYHGTPIDCPGLDRRGHKLAMAHQRAPGGRVTKDGHSAWVLMGGGARRSGYGVGRMSHGHCDHKRASSNVKCGIRP